MDEQTELSIKEVDEEEQTENLEKQLKNAREEIQSLTQQLNCLLVLTKNAWRGDESATLHLARVIGIDSEIEKNSFIEKKVNEHSSGKKTVTIAENDDIISKQTPSFASSPSQETLQDQEQKQQAHIQAAVRNSYLQPYLNQTHIDPIRGQDSRQIFNNMVRYHQNQMNNSLHSASRSSSSNVRPRATKHLYRPASAEHVVRHLGSPISRVKPYFVFAGKEFFSQTTNYSPLYQKAVVNSNVSRQSNHSDLSDESVAEPVIARPQTAKVGQHSSTRILSARSSSTTGQARASSALSNASSTKLSQMSERERRDTMRLQRQLNLPRQGWLNQYS